MTLQFSFNYAEAAMDSIDRSIIYCREKVPEHTSGFTIHIGRLELQSFVAWNRQHPGNHLFSDISGKPTLFGYPVLLERGYESLIQIKGRS